MHLIFSRTSSRRSFVCIRIIEAFVGFVASISSVLGSLLYWCVPCCFFVCNCCSRCHRCCYSLIWICYWHCQVFLLSFFPFSIIVVSSSILMQLITTWSLPFLDLESLALFNLLLRLLELLLFVCRAPTPPSPAGPFCGDLPLPSSFLWLVAVLYHPFQDDDFDVWYCHCPAMMLRSIYGVWHLHWHRLASTSDVAASAARLLFRTPLHPFWPTRLPHLRRPPPFIPIGTTPAAVELIRLVEGGIVARSS